MMIFRLLISVCICIISLLIDYSSLFENNLDILKNEYGEGYGTDWMYFPDDKGAFHYIDLKLCKNEKTAARSAAAFELEQLIATPDDIEFRLYTRNAITYILLNYQGRAVKDCDQDTVTKILRSSLPIKMITHGWQSSADNKGLLNITNAYLLMENVNVITVDWSAIADSVLYVWAAYATSIIGVMVAIFLDALNKEYKVTGDQLHLIGHSLGAHVMGNAAAKTNSLVYRITGLDPARPFYETPDCFKFKRLEASDADIVDVIHTCAGLLGFEGAIGTVDFFPNDGRAPQPGCDDFPKFMEACSHSMSWHYFLESILHPNMYKAYKCSSWQDYLDRKCTDTGYMGEAVNRNMTGRYYLTTNGTELSR